MSTPVQNMIVNIFTSTGLPSAVGTESLWQPHYKPKFNPPCSSPWYSRPRRTAVEEKYLPKFLRITSPLPKIHDPLACPPPAYKLWTHTPPSCMCHNTIREVKNHLNSHLKYPHDNYNILCPKPDLHSQGRVTPVSLYHRRDVTYIHRYQLWYYQVI